MLSLQSFLLVPRASEEVPGLYFQRWRTFIPTVSRPNTGFACIKYLEAAVAFPWLYLREGHIKNRIFKFSVENQTALGQHQRL